MPSPKELAKALAYQGEIRNTSRNRLLGGVADVLSPVSEFADQYKISDRIPFLGGMSAADLTGLKGAQSLVNDMSYGKSPISGASLQTTKVDPRVLDLAGVSGAMMPVAKSLGKAALREGAKQVQNKTGIIGRNVIDPRMSVVPDDQAMSVSNRLLDTTGLENRGRDLIQGKAEELAQRMREAGVTVDLQHSGSVAGPSSYIKVVGMPDIRISGHSKGVFNSGGVLNVASPEEFDNVLAMAIKNQQQYNSQQAVMKNMYEDAAIPIRLKSADKKIAKGLKLTNSEQAAVNVRAAPKPIDVGGAMMQRPKTEFEILHDTAQRNAALPVKQGGLGLPSNNTYIDRANVMYPTDVYHGSNLPIEQIDPAMLGSSTGAKSAKQAFWVVDNPTVARGYAEYAANEAPVAKILKDAEFQGKVAQRTGNWDKYESLVTKAEELESANQANPLNGQNIMPLRINTNNSSVMDAGGNSFPYAENDINQFLRQSKYAGNDVAQIKNLDDAVGRVDLPANHYAVFNPANIRSRFAAFDPMRRHEADILAGVGVGGMLDPQAIAEALRQQDRK